MHIASIVAIVGCLLPWVSCGQSVKSEPPPSGGVRFETTPLSSASALGITEIPLPVDMNLATQFVKIGFGPLILGETGFQSTQFLTPTLSTRQASQLVVLVPVVGWAWLLLELYILPGSPGGNRYGPHPTFDPDGDKERLRIRYKQ